jgi:CBS domain-containing protein
MLLHDWITGTKAADIMVHKLVTVDPSQPLSEVAAVMLREQISGLPVVDETGFCRGVFAVSDFLRAKEKVTKQQQEQQVIASNYFSSNLALTEGVDLEKLEQVRGNLTPASEQPVERFMTTDLVSVLPETSVETIAQSMVDAHLHRVLVIGQNDQLQGIIATTDVLAALLRGSLLAEMSSETKHLHEHHHL